MFTFQNTLRVRYAETDRMGYVYYGNYAAYFESARVEALRSLGLSYRVMEDSGIALPVLEYKIKYYKPAYFDDLLTINLNVNRIPSGTRLYFSYSTYNEKNICINEGETSHVFVNIKTGRPCPVPDEVLIKLNPFFVE
jgi:acyl-CoA thioester hydrolase